MKARSGRTFVIAAGFALVIDGALAAPPLVLREEGAVAHVAIAECTREEPRKCTPIMRSAPELLETFENYVTYCVHRAIQLRGMKSYPTVDPGVRIEVPDYEVRQALVPCPGKLQVSANALRR